MDRDLVKGLLLIILLPAIFIPAYSAWVEWQDFQNFKVYFGKISKVIDEGIKTNTASLNKDYQQSVNDWNKRTSGKLERIYSVHHSDGRETTDEMIPITRDLFDALFQLRVEFADLAVVFASERMKDRKTVSNKDSYEWRLTVLNSIDEFSANYEQRIDQLIEIFHQSLEGSSLPEKFREYVWQEWADGIKAKLIKLGPDVEYLNRAVVVYRQLFSFLYEHKDAYHINKSNRIVFTNQAYADMYSPIMKSVGEEW